MRIGRTACGVLRRLGAASLFGLVLVAGCGGDDDIVGAGEQDTGAIDNDANLESSTTDSAIDSGATTDSSVEADSTTTDTGTDSAASDSASGTDTTADVVVPADAGPPTLTIATPTAGASIAFNLTSDACQGSPFSVAYTAPAGFATMKWTFFVPSSGTGASCGVAAGGAPKAAYGYFMDPAVYGGSVTGTLNENVSIAGLYGTGTRWWWCTAPTAPQGVVATPPAPAVSLNTLSNYCYSKTNGGTPTNTAEQWMLEVILTDKAGKTVTATQKFWIHN